MAENVFLSQRPTALLGLNINDVIDVIKEQSDHDMPSLFGGGATSEANYSVLSSVASHPEPENDLKKNAYVQITEQPQPKALRFRYICEGRSAGSIPGVSSTAENKTYPSIKVYNYKGHAFVVVSCVTVDPPYRPHPHNLVGKSCKNGICTMKITNDSMECMFSNIGIQCVKKKEVEQALALREEQRVDPYRTGFNHRNVSQSIDLNSVRLCFQVFLEGREKGKFTYPLSPVVSDPIYDKKATSDLVICKLSDCTSTVRGGKEIILLCDKVTKEDIQIRFFEVIDGVIHWEAYGDFQASDVHKQVAISFKTPKYKDTEILNSVKVWIQLIRPSDKNASEARPFEYHPLDSDMKRKAAKIMNYNNLTMYGYLPDDSIPTPKTPPDPSTGTVPRQIRYASRPSRLSDKVKIEPQDIGLSPPPDMAGVIEQKIPISPQHNVGGIVRQIPSSTPPSMPNYIPDASYFLLPHCDSRSNIPMLPLLMSMADGGRGSSTIPLYNENVPSVESPMDMRESPSTPMTYLFDLDLHKPIMESNDDDLVGIKSSELIRVDANEAFLNNFSSSLTFEDSVHTSNQLDARNEVPPDSCASSSFLPNIPSTNCINVFQKVDDSIPTNSSESLKNLKSSLEMLKNLAH